MRQVHPTVASAVEALVGEDPTEVASAGVAPTGEDPVEEAAIRQEAWVNPEVGRQEASEEEDLVSSRAAWVGLLAVPAIHQEVLACRQVVADLAADHCHQVPLEEADLEVPADRGHPEEVSKEVVAACRQACHT